MCSCVPTSHWVLQGSTGVPKGVQLEHAGVAALLRYYSSICPSITPGDAFLQSMSFFFGAPPPLLRLELSDDSSAGACLPVLGSDIPGSPRFLARNGICVPVRPADGSVMDIWWPLSLGGTIVVPSPEQLRDPAATRALIRHHAVVFLMIVPTHFQVRPLQRWTVKPTVWAATHTSAPGRQQSTMSGPGRSA